MKAILLLISCASACIVYSQTAGPGVTDYDGNYYTTAYYDGVEWMTENLKAIHFANSENIPDVVDDMTWLTSSTAASVAYLDDPSLEADYGRLYNYYAVNDSRGLCPTGWRVPTDMEYAALADLFGGVFSTDAAIYLKATGTIQAGTGLWNDPNNGTNASNFGAIPAGRRVGSTGEFMGVGAMCDLWTSVANDGLSSWEFSVGNVAGIGSEDPRTGLSVRCIKSGPVGIGEIQLSPERVLLKVTDLMGREVDGMNRNNEVLLYIYSDGFVERKFFSEK